MITNLNAWIEKANKKHARMMRAIAKEEKAMAREERWARIGAMVTAALPGIKVEPTHFGVEINVFNLAGLHAARTALIGAIPDYSDEIIGVESEYATIYTVAEIKEQDKNIKIKYGYNGPDRFYDGAIIRLLVPYSQVPESVFSGGKCGFEDDEYTPRSVSFVCKKE